MFIVTDLVSLSQNQQSRLCTQRISSQPRNPVADPEGVPGVRSNPLPVPVFKHPMKMK